MVLTQILSEPKIDQFYGRFINYGMYSIKLRNTHWMIVTKKSPKLSLSAHNIFSDHIRRKKRSVSRIRYNWFHPHHCVIIAVIKCICWRVITCASPLTSNSFNQPSTPVWARSRLIQSMRRFKQLYEVRLCVTVHIARWVCFCSWFCRNSIFFLLVSPNNSLHLIHRNIGAMQRQIVLWETCGRSMNADISGECDIRARKIRAQMKNVCRFCVAYFGTVLSKNMFGTCSEQFSWQVIIID